MKKKKEFISCNNITTRSDTLVPVPINNTSTRNNVIHNSSTVTFNNTSHLNEHV